MSSPPCMRDTPPSSRLLMHNFVAVCLIAASSSVICHVQGSDYFNTELARLERLLEGGKLSPSKLSDISRKISVLGAFQDSDEADVHSAEE